MSLREYEIKTRVFVSTFRSPTGSPCTNGLPLCLNNARLILLKPSVNKTAGIVHRSKIYPAMAALGHSRRRRSARFSGACPLFPESDS
jgi:hypothetical protein